MKNNGHRPLEKFMGPMRDLGLSLSALYLLLDFLAPGRPEPFEGAITVMSYATLAALILDLLLVGVAHLLIKPGRQDRLTNKLLKTGFTFRRSAAWPAGSDDERVPGLSTRKAGEAVGLTDTSGHGTANHIEEGTEAV